MKIGIEFEFIPKERSVVHFIESLPYKGLTKVEGLKDMYIGRDKEYYPEVHEICFVCDHTQIKQVSNFINKIPGEKSSNTLFIGTHVHYFDEELYQKFIPSHRTDVKIWNTIIKKISKTNIINKEEELSRLIRSHHLWGQTNIKTGFGIDSVLRKNDLRRLEYREKQRLPKYCITNKSEKTEAGKPNSVEIRCFPNELLISHPDLFEHTVLQLHKKISAINKQEQNGGKIDLSQYRKLCKHYSLMQKARRERQVALLTNISF